MILAPGPQENQSRHGDRAAHTFAHDDRELPDGAG
jgi:hypothetical protein